MAETVEENPEDGDFCLLMEYTHGFMVSQALLLVEAVLNIGGWGLVHAALLSLTMLVQRNGRKRTEAEYHAMATTTSFVHCSHNRSTGGDLDVMLAQK